MPALPDVPQVIRFRLNWTDDNDANIYNNTFFRYTGSAPSSSDISNLATAVANAYGAQVASWASSVHLIGVEATDLTSATAAQGNVTCDFQGTNDSGRLAGGTAVVISYLIARRYRGGKPRNYFPWGSVNDLNSAQQWNTGSVSGWAAAIAAITSSIIGTTVGGTTLADHVNVSYYQGFTVEGGTGGKRAKNVPTLRPTPVVDTIVGRNVLIRPGSQR